MKKLIYLLYAIPFSMLICIIICDTVTPHHTSPISEKQIRKVKLGMSKQQVVSLLGKPVYESFQTFQCTPAYNHHYPMLWVHFNDSGKVRQVYAKYYDWLDDRGVYGLSKDDSGNVVCWGEEALKNYFRSE